MSWSPPAPGPSRDSLESSPPATGQLLLVAHDSVSPPSPGPISPPASGAPAQIPVVGIAAGSAAAAAVLVLLGLYLVVALRKRRTGRGHRAAATPTPGVGSGSSQEQQSANIYPPIPPAGPRELQKRHSVELTPSPTGSSNSSSATPLVISGESSKSQHPGLRGQPPLPGGEILFRGAFAYGELAAATNGFSDSNLVGRGGFGDVYVGTVDGITVAVKRLRAGSQQGDPEFQAELQIISRVHHRNLVSLVGYCVADGGQRLLVYEFVPNMSLEHHLHGPSFLLRSKRGDKNLLVHAAIAARHEPFTTFFKMYLFTESQCYLGHPRIIHRDIKAANILLDPEFNPKLSDFGMAKFMPGGDTHIATRIVGTIGYLAPEYASSGRLTEKSDVFSYGVVLLELLTGMNVAVSSNPDVEGTLVGWARPLLTRALELLDYNELIDPQLGSFDADQMERLIVRHLEGDASAAEIDACGFLSFGYHFRQYSFILKVCAHHRYKIALGVGSAILYLHTECVQCVLHSDIKPANILLDHSCNAKLGDFGLTRLVDHGTDSRTTQVVAGTPGYMDPEFDIFSFGVVEIACGRRPTTKSNGTPVLMNWVRDMYSKDSILAAADQRLDGEFDHQQMRRVLVVGLWCTHEDQSQRPSIAPMDLLRRQDAELPVLDPVTHIPDAVRSMDTTLPQIQVVR
ncbi:Proline-rich receptor-like protein kinase PERK4 [Dichanthelium oligosanthes]|uniref:non-specific serine/threonine protein kinase n=1 Tax=Dichanthelium oligosanthes TaxID=888268 RepID=A0A1E5VQ73_9POAL|nr:Proline-rich receptor-like protein kinase PERK4 [Dichanthelium oligosanthes]